MLYRIRFDSPLQDDEERPPEEQTRAKRDARLHSVLLIVLLIVAALFLTSHTVGVIECVAMITIGLGAMYYAYQEQRATSVQREEEEEVRTYTSTLDLFISIVGFLVGVVLVILLSMRLPQL